MTSELSSRSHCHLAFVSLALGFLVIWMAGLAGVLICKTLKDEATAKEAADIFQAHEDVAKITFALGHEMVSTVDWLLSDTGGDERTLTVTWQMSDAVLNTVPSTGTTMGHLALFRQTVRRSSTSPLETTSFYLGLAESVVAHCLRLDALGQPAAGLAYAIFLRGMALRFAQLALGTIYVRSELPVNATQYLRLEASSEELMETAFQLSPRARAKWWDLQERAPKQALSDVGEDMASGSSRRHHLAAAFLEEAKEQVALLLLARETLNGTLASWTASQARTARATLTFHSSVAGVALLAVVICLIGVIWSFRRLGASASRPEDEAPVLPPKPHCYM
ncbi:uncharacterized protein LOC135386291 [Ornithodoros turicata]|uniref:Putative secreted protein n=1 Tax=Ornithodoros turicata TaxID=34597 RepID=A0A2R5L4V2_9ACAR